MPDQDFKIHIITDADNSGFKSAADASSDLNKSLGNVSAGNAELTKATEKTTESLGESRRTARELGGELSRVTGIGRLASVALGGVAAAAFGAGAAVELLKGTWERLRETITGPIDIGIPPEAPKHISAAAEAWEAYATARAKVVATQNSPEAAATARETELANELKLLKEVLAAEKEKALVDLDLKKSSLSPEAYAAAKVGIEDIFGAAGNNADARNRRQLIANKYEEAANLEIDARTKLARALEIKAAPSNVAESNQTFLDAQAAKAQSALAEINERIEFIKKVASPDRWDDYVGPLGAVNKFADRGAYYSRYGGTEADFAGNLANEEQRRAQAEAIIQAAENYKRTEGAAQGLRSELSASAGAESARATALRASALRDSGFESRQNSTDAIVAQLHSQSAAQIVGASGSTVQAVRSVTAATLGGFADIRTELVNFNRELIQLRAQIRAQRIGGK